MSIEDSSEYDRLDRLAEEFADRCRRGERPTLEEYLGRYPELADEIREVFPALAKVRQAAGLWRERDGPERAGPVASCPSRIGDYRVGREIGRGGMGIVYEAEQVSLGRRVALKVLPGSISGDRLSLERFRREARSAAQLHHTNIVPVFEVGEEGDVSFYAMQLIRGESLDSVIAELRRLRIRSLPPRGRAAGPGEPRRSDTGGPKTAAASGVAWSLLSGRFERGPTTRPDARGGATVASPGAPLSTASTPTIEHDASAVMPGGTQLSSVDSRHRAFHRGVAQIGRQVASALAHAHAHGIVHRDIKPSNLLLDTEGVAWVSDFGLAKVVDDDLTRTGDLLGTIRYMAPERFRGEADARADIYALGLTLYELLTLRPAFDSADRLGLSDQIKTADPPRPRSIDSRIPRDLETIILKAIEKDPGHRYPTAEAMAEDLRRYLDDETILARRAGVAERSLRWARRHPGVATVAGVLAAVMVGSAIVSTIIAGRMATLADVNRRAAESEREAKLAARAAQQRAEQNAYIARIGQAAGALRLSDPFTARGLLDLCRPGPGEPDFRGWEWSYLDQWCNPELRVLALPAAVESHSLALSPDGRLLAVGCAAPYTRRTAESPPVPAYLLGLPDGRVRHELHGHRRFVHAVAFRPDGRRLASVGDEGTIRIHDVESGRGLREMEAGVPSYLNGELSRLLDWSPDGRRLACAEGNMLRIRDPETGRETCRLDWNARSVAWSPDGARIACALENDSGLAVGAWDTRAQRLRGPSFRRPGWVQALCWSPDGRRLAAITRPHGHRTFKAELIVWDATSGEDVFRVEQAVELASVAFSPDGSRLATAGKEGIVRVLDATDGREDVALLGRSQNIGGLSYSADGRRLLAAGWGMGGVKVFDSSRNPRGRGVRLSAYDIPQVGALTFDREGLKAREITWRDRALVSFDTVDGRVRTERVLPVTDIARWPRNDFAFSRDGSRLAAPTREDPSVIGVWDAALGRSVARLGGSSGPVMAVAFGPDDRTLAAATDGGPGGRPAVTLWDIASARPIRTLEAGTAPAGALAFGDDGRRIAAAGGTNVKATGWVAVWDAESGAMLRSLGRLGVVTSLAFHPDDARVAVADYRRGKVHLWDIRAGTLITSPGPTSVSSVAFTPDGKRLAALGYDGNVHLVDARTGDEVLVLHSFGPPPGSLGFTPRLAFSLDGSRLAASALDNGVNFLNLWDHGPLSGLSAEPRPDDAAGWLRRSCALAERGDADGAGTAAARARDLRAGGAAPWIEHAVWLHRGGDATGARDALARALEDLPDDPGCWVDLVRRLDRLGWAEGSAAALAKVRSLLRRRLARAPDDDLAAAALAEVLGDDDLSTGWTVLRPETMASAGGATLIRLPDDSVLADGPNPAHDTYTIEAVTRLPAITGVRLELIPDPRLPSLGPGRFPPNGAFFLRGFRVAPVPGPSSPAALLSYVLYQMPAGESRHRGGIVEAGRFPSYSAFPREGQPHTAVFLVARPIGHAGGSRVRIELDSGAAGYPTQTLGRFRLSVTDRPLPRSWPVLRRIAVDPERSGPTRLGAAHGLLGDWASAAAVLDRAGARTNAAPIDGFLLALARHHLGRGEEARSDCDRALDRLRAHRPDIETRAVALEALATVRGLGDGDAESLLLDATFPVDPFAHQERDHPSRSR